MDSQQGMRFNRVAIHDPDVNNIEGASLLVPEGWTVGGGFHWTPDFSQQADLLIQVNDPNTGASAFTLPSQQFVWTTQPLEMPVWSNWLGSVLLPPAGDASRRVRVRTGDLPARPAAAPGGRADRRGRGRAAGGGRDLAHRRSHTLRAGDPAAPCL